MPDLMPTEPILKEKWRAEGILAWLTKNYPKRNQLADLKQWVEEQRATLAALRPGTGYADYSFRSDSSVIDRYWVLLLTGLAMEWHSDRSVATLEEAEDVVLRFTDMAVSCRVFDTHLRRELKFRVVRNVKWENVP